MELPRKTPLTEKTPRKHSSAPSYTMLAFHQWGFSSGWEDRIPVPAVGEDRGSGLSGGKGCAAMGTTGRCGMWVILLGHNKAGGPGWSLGCDPGPLPLSTGCFGLGMSGGRSSRG